MASTAADLLWPTTETYVSCSWQCHKNRNPPSAEPGTDVAAGYGSDVKCAGDGTVYATYSNTGAAGRVVEVRLDDGRTVRYLHMSSYSVSKGQKVKRGQVVGKSGASGYGEDWYYGPHVHVTLLSTWTTPLNQSVDFEKYVGDDDMPISTEDAEKIARTVWGYVSTSTAGGFNMAYLVRDIWGENTAAIVEDGKTVKNEGEQVTRAKDIQSNVKKILTFLPVTFTDEQIAEIARAISEGVQVPPISDADLAKIAKWVNDEMARRLTE